MSRTLALFTVVGLLAGCSGNAGPEAADRDGQATPATDAATAAPTETDDGGTSTTGPEATPDEPEGGGAAGEGGATDDGGANADSTATTGGAGGSSDADPGTEATEPPAEPAGPAIAAGTYTYDSEGTNQFGTFDPQPFEAVLTTDVEPAEADGTQRSATTTEYTSGSSPRTFDEDRTLRHTEDAILLVRLVTDGNGEDIEFVLDPPVVFSPADPADGETWGWTMTSTDGGTTVETTVTAVGSQAREVGGTTVQVRRADVELVFTGEDFEGTQTMTTWFHPETRLSVGHESVLEGRARVGGAWIPIRTEEQRELRSLDPS